MSTEQPTSATAAALVKDLASTANSIRAKALKRLTAWLPAQENLSEDDMKKLWKALFYCVWHSDKVVYQQQLISRLSSLLLDLSPSLALLYFSHFITALRREWLGIDHLRLDKFYLLIRFFIRHLFILMNKENWNLDVVEKYVRVLDERAFSAGDDKGLGYGVSYQIVSVFCEEIKPFLPLKLDILKALFSPFVGVLGRTSNKVLVGKIKSEIFEFLLSSGKSLLAIKKSGEEADLKDETCLFGTIALVLRFSGLFYELGSSPDCVQGNRKIAYGLHESFLKLEKEQESSAVDVSLPLVIEDLNGEEIPTLIPINEKANGGVNPDEPSKKKNKKEKKTTSKKGTKKKGKKKEELADMDEEGHSIDNGDAEMTALKDDNLNAEPTDDNHTLAFDESVISNLQKQFEKVAAEAGLVVDGVGSLDSLTTRVNGKTPKKRNRAKGVTNAEESLVADMNAEGDGLTENDETKALEKSVKKVKFSMNSNIVWKPHNPLPPQSLRLPPSATPRGSALKKGVPAGPIRESSSERKKKKKLKKVKRVVKSVTPAVKRVRKLKPVSV